MRHKYKPPSKPRTLDICPSNIFISTEKRQVEAMVNVLLMNISIGYLQK